MGSNDSFTEVTSQNWFSRLGQSIKGVLVGVLLFIAAIPVLWMNESNSVAVYQGLQEGKGEVISLAEPKVDATKDGKLVHLSGMATTTDMVTDPVLGISENAIRIIRKVQMYQWEEQSSSKTRDKVGGGQETTTTYNYVKTWSSSVINSGSFKKSGYYNPGSMEIPNAEFNAQNVTVGDFTLPQSLISSITKGEAIPITDNVISTLPYNLQGRARAAGNELYVGYNPSSPQIGDLKVSVEIVRPQQVSIVAQQRGNSFEQYLTKKKTRIMMLSAGTLSAEIMFQQAEEANVMWTWIKRLIGFLMMFIGISMIFKPISTFGAVIPIVGSILSFGLGIFAFVIALACALVIIAIAWIAARPILGIALLVVGVGAFVAFKILGKNKTAPASA